VQGLHAPRLCTHGEATCPWGKPHKAPLTGHKLKGARVARRARLGEIAIEARGLRKVYSDGTVALDSVSLVIPGGSIFCLLGRNGAGKTTFVRIASTQLLPTSGSVLVLGHDVLSEAERIRPYIAVVPQEGRPASLMTPREHIVHYLVARGFSWQQAKHRARRALEQLELLDWADQICSNLSGGLRQRTLVAMAFASDAQLLFLDEPTLGLDPVTRLRVWDAIRHMVRREGRTVLLTTHYMDEAEALSDAIAIMHGGRVVAQGTLAQLLAPYRDYVRIDVPASFLQSVEVYEGGQAIRLGDRARAIMPRKVGQELAEEALRRGLDLNVRAVGLEDLFLLLAGEGLEG